MLCDLGRFLDDICASAAAKVGDDVSSGIGELSRIDNDVTGKLAEKLGI